ncbi:Actin-interacting protein 1, partial [Fasciola gigantica]
NLLHPFVSSQTHNAFVNIVRYCPTGSCLVSAGADGKIFVYDGNNGKELYELGSPAHKGGVYGIAFSKDGSRLVSVSADKTLKLWMVEGIQFTFLSEYSFGTTINNMVVSYVCFPDSSVIFRLIDCPFGLHVSRANLSSSDQPATRKHQTRISLLLELISGAYPPPHPRFETRALHLEGVCVTTAPPRSAPS